jgi:CBS domain containing-hemolysin-like protein
MSETNRSSMNQRKTSTQRWIPSWTLWVSMMLVAVCPSNAHASIFQGETLDTLANILAWVVLFVAPAVGIVVFWMLHILPEKIAEKKHHPQAKAIQTLCLLSLFFGGLLWPIAWLWAYSKPVLYKMAYGTDKVVHGQEDVAHAAASTGDDLEGPELERLRKRVIELERKLAAKPAAEVGKA